LIDWIIYCFFKVEKGAYVAKKKVRFIRRRNSSYVQVVVISAILHYLEVLCWLVIAD